MCVHCDISGCSADIHLMHKCVVLSPYIDMYTCHDISICPHVTIYQYVHMSRYVVGSEKRGNIALFCKQRYGSKHVFA